MQCIYLNVNCEYSNICKIYSVKIVLKFNDLICISGKIAICHKILCWASKVFLFFSERGICVKVFLFLGEMTKFDCKMNRIVDLVVYINDTLKNIYK